MSRLQKKPAHKRGHPTLQNMNFFYFCGSFLPSWIRIRIQITDPDPDPMVRLNTDPIRIRIRNPVFIPEIQRDRTSLQCCKLHARVLDITGTHYQGWCEG